MIIIIKEEKVEKEEEEEEHTSIILSQAIKFSSGKSPKLVLQRSGNLEIVLLFLFWSSIPKNLLFLFSNL